MGEGEDGAEDDVLEEGEEEVQEAEGVGHAGADGGGADDGPPEDEGGGEHGEVLQEVDAFGGEGGVVGGGGVPDPDGCDEYEPGDDGDGDALNGESEEAGGVEGRADASSDGAGECPEDAGHGVGELEEGRGGHHQEEMLDHVHEEEVAGVDVDGGEEGDDEGEEAGEVEEVAGFAWGRVAGAAAQAPPAYEVEGRGEDEGDYDVGRGVPMP